MKKFSSPVFGFILLIGVFATVFCLSVGSSLIFDKVSAYSDGKKLQPVPADYPRLSADLRSQLDGGGDLPVEAQTVGFDTANNPFSDRTNLANLAAAKNNQVNGSFNNPVVAPGANVLPPMPNNPGGKTVFAQSPTVSAVPNMPPNIPVGNSDETLNLYRQRQRDRLNGQTDNGKSSEIYSIDEVRPLGVTGRGDKREILFYSPTTKQTFTAPRGSRFRDGEMEDVNETGVSFRKTDRSQVTTKWARNAAGAKTADADTTDEAVIETNPNPHQVNPLPPLKRRKISKGNK